MSFGAAAIGRRLDRNLLLCTAVAISVQVTLPRTTAGESSTPQERERPVSSGSAAASRSAETETAAESDSDAETVRRKRKIQAAFYLLGGIAFVGALTILGVLLWGIRVRRRAREQLKPGSAPDPLWYLRKENKEKPAADPEDRETDVNDS